MIGLEQLSIHHSYDQDWFSHADPYAWITLSPGGLRYASPVLHNTNAGNLQTYFYIPLGATSVAVEIYDEDELTREGSAFDDLIGRFTLQLPGASRPTCNPGANSQCSFSANIITTLAGTALSFYS